MHKIHFYSVLRTPWFSIVKPGSHIPAICLCYHCSQQLKHKFFCKFSGWTATNKSPPTRQSMWTRLNKAFKCQQRLDFKRYTFWGHSAYFYLTFVVGINAKLKLSIILLPTSGYTAYLSTTFLSNCFSFADHSTPCKLRGKLVIDFVIA